MGMQANTDYSDYFGMIFIYDSMNTKIQTKEMGMLTELGLNKVKAAIMKLAQRDDKEVNDILQAAVTAMNKLKISRFPH